jgi:hypothetical protein
LIEGPVASRAIEGSGGGAAAVAPRLRALLLLRSSDGEGAFESLRREMHLRDHEVLVFDHQQLPPRRGVWPIVAGAVRRSLDYLRDVESERTDTPGRPDPLRDEALDRPPRSFRVLLLLPPFRWPSGRRLLDWLLRRLEAGIPIPRRVKSFISGQAPDVVLVSPLVEFDEPGGDFVRTAEAMRIPSMLLATSQNELESVEAIERAARAQVVPRREGRFLRPLLWLLTPLVAIVLAILRPRATFRAVRRLPNRIRKWFRARKRAGKQRRTEIRKAQATAAQQEKQARAQAKRQAKAEAATSKAERRARREAKERARAEGRQESEQADG